VDYARTPIGKFNGALSAVRPDDLAAAVLRALAARNPDGGAIAIGHPLGCTGVRLVGTLARELHARGGGLGVATACIGVGQGLAVVLEA
jgi:acetyl-CoA acetyltransferase